MTVLSDTNRNQYNCNGSQTVFPYTFRILDETHIQVVLTDSGGNETILTLNTDYTVSGVDDVGGGNITTVSAYASGYTLTFIRDIPATQETDYVENDPFPAESHEQALDKITMLIQQMKEELARCPALAASSALSNLLLPMSASRAIGWNSVGDGLTTYATTAVIDPAWDSIQNHGSDLAQMVSDIGAGKATVLIDTAPNEVTADLTVPDNIHLVILQGCLTPVASGVTLTVESLEAGPYQIFSGGGLVVLAQTAMPNWYCTGSGTSADPWVSTDGTAGLYQALTSGALSVLLAEGYYQITSALSAISTNGISIVGAGRLGTVVKYTLTSGTVIELDGIAVTIENLTLQGSGTSGTETALRLGNGSSGSRHRLKNVKIANVGGCGLCIDSFIVDLCNIDIGTSGADCIQIDNSGGIISINGGSYIHSATDSAVKFIGGSMTISISDTNIESNACGIYSGAASASPNTLLLSQVHFEGNTVDVRAGSGLRGLEITNSRIGGNITTTALNLANATNCKAILANNWWDSDTTIMLSQNSSLEVTMVGANQNFDYSKVSGTRGVWRWDTRNLSIAISSASTSSTSETDLHSYDLPQYLGSVAQAVKIMAAGTKTGGADTKTIKLYVGSASYTVHPAANNTNDWRLEATLIFRNNTVQTLSWVCWDGTTVSQGYEAPGQDFTLGTVPIKLTGQCSDGTDLITETMFEVDLE